MRQGQVMLTILNKNYNIALSLYVGIATTTGMALRLYGGLKKWMSCQPLTLPFGD
jgi:hypothetical protein